VFSAVWYQRSGRRLALASRPTTVIDASKMRRSSHREAQEARISRRTALIAGAAIVGGLPRDARADDVPVPIAVQCDLLVKVAAYDRNLPARAGSKALVLLVTKRNDAESARVAAAMTKELSAHPTIAGLPHDEATATFTDAASLAQACRARRVAVLFLASGFGDGEVAAVAKALAGGDVLSAAAVPSYVATGVVLGFDLVSGKPKLLCNQSQARRQNVALGAEVLQLMKVLA
jgi:hypothetical protein